MNFQTIIAARRDGRRHSSEELQFLAKGAATGEIPDYQLAAWLMAAYLNPLSDEETAALTMAMANSGERMDLTGLPKPWLDKHSTGGVGDKATLIVLPILAACGLTLVKMSGRGLGITGGTIDKLESVPGFRTALSPEEMKAQAAKIGLALTGQSPNLAPADKALYALRDVTGTVASIPLLVSSILSKKIAGGAETIVLDVKSGSGGFLGTDVGARDLAEALARTAKACGLHCRLALTDMEQPLGSAGNALEVLEARAILSGQSLHPSTKRVRELCLIVSGMALEATGRASTFEEGKVQAAEALDSGRAREKASQWFAAQGATFEAALPSAPVVRAIRADRAGFILRIDARTVGETVVALGGGRRKKEDRIDHRVGIETLRCVGDPVEKGDELLRIHAADESSAEAAAAQVQPGLSIGESLGPNRPLLIARF